MRILEKQIFEKNPIVTHIIVSLKSDLHNSADFQSFDLKFWILKALDIVRGQAGHSKGASWTFFPYFFPHFFLISSKKFTGIFDAHNISK